MPIDVKKFTEHLRKHALAKLGGTGACAKWVRQALQAGGGSVPASRPPFAKDWGPTLLMMGFHETKVDDPDTFHFVKGDIVVIQPYPGGRIEGHMAGFDGKNWISDFIQRDFWSGPGYRSNRPNYVVYRA